MATREQDVVPRKLELELPRDSAPSHQVHDGQGHQSHVSDGHLKSPIPAVPQVHSALDFSAHP